MSWLRRVEDGLWRLCFALPTPTNVWLVEHGDGLTLVDAGMPWCGEAILRAAGRIGRPLRRLVVTHAHPDHAGAAAFLARVADVEVLAHRDDVPYLTGAASMADLPGTLLCRTILRLGRRLRMLDAPWLRDVTPLEEGDEVAGMRVIHTPGHTPGSLTLWEAARQALYCGDNVAYSYFWLHLGNRIFTLDPMQRNRSVARCLDAPSRLLLPGHGPAWKGDVNAALRRLIRVERRLPTAGEVDAR